MDAILNVEGLVKHFPIRKGLFQSVVGHVKAVDGVSLRIPKGKTMGLVGESGSGKTTTGRTLLHLIEPTAGKVTFDGQDVSAKLKEDPRWVRRSMQIIFQDPYGSLNPRRTVMDIVGEAPLYHRIVDRSSLADYVGQVLEMSGLKPSDAMRYPHEFSGGQRQRIGIARALAVRPRFLVCDEPVSALDVSIRSQILNLLKDLRDQLGLTYLFISHDMSVVRHISDHVAVMYLGKLVESAPKGAFFKEPLHPYSKALLSAIPLPDPDAKSERIILEGDVPSPVNPPSGCRFHPRCAYAMDRCRTDEPPLADVGGREVACWLHCR
ncbi:ABC transporter ATP-binding protein [Thermanaerovibrio acidaminovorans]|jgi:oligopeptide/dipeptide ABC transporter ATP-binding protein|uniref:Oligopeptide/dipeptide ABC transporter, ATPase subunit n=1 Tax=Thermanaerovibrio acidaminovorans (strain ATCC 49978 / DSM 6589 / Su883) TaxID=525903 RepID=D1B7K1_THEAS|nr:oligopeptide/dipeptide ABC transporter ATP-binding protein [Thermanaerovibrio acidaminovorans]ACZ18254.1 oligopeptide/dipeptide ABC transporter, ATPase subunit [Thermanaerovibrio acidaminovorans DSM 6589]